MSNFVLGRDKLGQHVFWVHFHNSWAGYEFAFSYFAVKLLEFHKVARCGNRWVLEQNFSLNFSELVHSPNPLFDTTPGHVLEQYLISRFPLKSKKICSIKILVTLKIVDKRRQEVFKISHWPSRATNVNKSTKNINRTDGKGKSFWTAVLDRCQCIGLHIITVTPCTQWPTKYVLCKQSYLCTIEFVKIFLADSSASMCLY